MLWLILIITIAIYLVIHIRNRQSYWKKIGVTHLKPTFLIGTRNFFASKSPSEIWTNLYNLFPNERYTGIYQFLEPTLLIKDVELLKQITVKDFDHFVDHRAFASGDVDPFWSKNLLASQGEQWRRMRATLSPSFTGSKMKAMFGLMDECAQQYVDYYHGELQKKPMLEIEVKDSLSRFTNDVIATTAFGLKCNSLINKTNKFYLMGKEATDITLVRVLRFMIHSVSPTITKVFQIKVIPSKIAKYFSSVIENTVETRRSQNIVRPDMIHLLMEAQNEQQSENSNSKSSIKGEITIEDISSQAFLFFFAGFDTVSTHLSFTLYELAVNPEIQVKLRSEIRSFSGPINYETISKMKYLDMIHSESLRKWPPVIVTDRKVTKSFTIEPVLPHETRIHLKEGDMCWISVIGIHRDPQHYPDPDRFDPERFSEENKHTINQQAYLPFGLGPRNCIGSRFALLESKLLIYYVVKNFELVPVEKTHIPMVLETKTANPAAKGGMWIGFKQIQQ